MKSLLLLAPAAILVSGCVAYADPYGGGYGYSQPGYVQGSVYYNDGGGRGWRDRDRDGVPNRYDRDRDGDGVRDRWDQRPNDPRRR